MGSARPTGIRSSRRVAPSIEMVTPSAWTPTTLQLGSDALCLATLAESADRSCQRQPSTNEATTVERTRTTIVRIRTRVAVELGSSVPPSSPPILIHGTPLTETAGPENPGSWMTSVPSSARVQSVELTAPRLARGLARLGREAPSLFVWVGCRLFMEVCFTAIAQRIQISSYLLRIVLVLRDNITRVFR